MTYIVYIYIQKETNIIIYMIFIINFNNLEIYYQRYSLNFQYSQKTIHTFTMNYIYNNYL